ncbi:PREDICTED: uncharacterized protein LOC109348138 isoform X2 [Lupinus angustifolius]|uniref:uncharacterized protein LOC109348138 isoform X2 n=1 Tax=Lupinus angustifolius TaxID=3871 RepID=UPI00092F51EC|nr:PREDICTED: uncharacterized protein LOC109348138 isoform X2 [Lupinus angustifolius]
MAKRLVKQLQSTTSKPAIISTNMHFFSNGRGYGSGVTGFVAEASNKGTGSLESVGDAAKETVETAWDATKNTTQTVLETTTAEADTNVVDTVEYRSTEDLRGQLGDGCDKKVEFS